MRLYMYGHDKVRVYAWSHLEGGCMVWKKGDTFKSSLLFGGFITFSDNGVRL